jgi:hypothetical protein
MKKNEVDLPQSLPGKVEAIASPLAGDGSEFAQSLLRETEKYIAVNRSAQ